MSILRGSQQAAAAQLLCFHQYSHEAGLSSSGDEQHQMQLQRGQPSSAAASGAPGQRPRQREAAAAAGELERAVAGSPVVVFSASSSCCLCHVAKRLLRGMGASPRVVEMDELDGPRAAELRRLLLALMGGRRPAVPAIFVGGRLIGGLDRLIACHISGALIPQLKAAGALWL